MSGRFHLAHAVASSLVCVVSLVRDIHTQEDPHSAVSPAVFVFPLVGASPWKLSAMHERPADSAEGLGCIELRILGHAVEVFDHPKGQEGAATAMAGQPNAGLPGPHQKPAGGRNSARQGHPGGPRALRSRGLTGAVPCKRIRRRRALPSAHRLEVPGLRRLSNNVRLRTGNNRLSRNQLDSFSDRRDDSDTVFAHPTGSSHVPHLRLLPRLNR